VPGIIRARLHEGDPTKGIEVQPKFLTLREQESFYARNLRKKPLRYLLCVSTIEPRKNHVRLLAGWEVLKASIDPGIKLVVVGGLGWDYALTLRGFRPWIDRGELFMLNAVPAPDLRVLYRHATATVCPSVGEGFDFSGVEAMRSGGVVIASGIAVHREVYGDAAAYFDPYSTAELVAALKQVLYGDHGARVQEHLRSRGEEVSARYLPAQILPQWDRFLSQVFAGRKAAIAEAVARPVTAPVGATEEI
ncbi:MAG: glycosyltransferase family 4 protein, partial [Gammaproteobacteria bacterium]